MLSSSRFFPRIFIFLERVISFREILRFLSAYRDDHRSIAHFLLLGWGLHGAWNEQRQRSLRHQWILGTSDEVLLYIFISQQYVKRQG